MINRPVNPSDLIPVRGAYSHRISLPCIPGYEGIGIVEEIGPFVSSELLGQRVLPLRGEGTWQQYVLSSAELAVSIPTSIDDHTAAQLYINPLTAWLACTEVLRLNPDDILIVNACGSSIGRIFAQLSRILGFRLIAITRNNTYTEHLIELGASAVINTSESPLHAAVMELTDGHGATAAVDSIGGLPGTELAMCVRPHGCMLSIGLLSGTSVNFADIACKSRVNVNLFHLRHWNQQASVQTWQNSFDSLKALVVQRKLKLMKPHSEYKLDHVQEAVRIAEHTSQNTGKIFLISERD
jgi:NADPH:quinone reductase-like Zn-dependent oxidoreductase